MSELTPQHVLADLGSADFPAEVLDPDKAAEIVIQRLKDASFAVVPENSEVAKLHAEIERLQAAKRRVLQLADERAKEAVELRRQIAELEGRSGGRS
jgi:hypothetical protein